MRDLIGYGPEGKDFFGQTKQKWRLILSLTMKKALS
ncbi:Uncharacterised protein [Legionella sainthelensi]|nr:Uncharacterised protein [Legionella sainthelensi]